MALNFDSKIKDLLANEQAKAAVAREIPGLVDHPQIGFAKGMTLRAVIKMMPSMFPPQTIQKLQDIMNEYGGGNAGTFDSGPPKKAPKKKKRRYNFDEIIPRENTNSVKYDTGPVLYPDLPSDYIPMWVADMDFACPQPVLDAMKGRIDKRILGYSMPLDPDYYLAVIGWMKRRFDWDIEFESIIFSSGVIEALYQCVKRLTQPGEGVILHTPAYHPFDDAIKEFGRTPVYSKLIDTDGYFTINYKDLEKKAKDPKNTLLFFCSPQNPTGRVWTKTEIRQVADICLANGVFIVSDEIHFDIRRSGQQHIPLAKLYPSEKRIITCTAPSKTFNLAGNQLSNIIINDPDLAAEWRMQRYCGMPNPLSIDACKAAYNECEDWADAMNAYVDKNFDYVDEFIKKKMPKAKFTIPQGTYLAWVDLRGYGLSDAEVKERVIAEGLFIEFADEFVADGEGFVRMNLACPLSVVKRAMTMLKNALEPESAEGRPLKAGDKMPDFTYTGPFVKKRKLSAAVGKKKTALLFLRYLGCTVCQLDIHNLKEGYDKIKQTGGQVKVVLQSDPALVAQELGSKDALPFEIICDPDQTLYHRFAVKPVKNKVALGTGKGVMAKISAAQKAGFKHGKYEGEELQLPACFVVDPDLTVTHVHYGKSIADVPDAGQLAAWLDE